MNPSCQAWSYALTSHPQQVGELLMRFSQVCWQASKVAVRKTAMAAPQEVSVAAVASVMSELIVRWFSRVFFWKGPSTFQTVSQDAFLDKHQVIMSLFYHRKPLRLLMLSYRSSSYPARAQPACCCQSKTDTPLQPLRQKRRTEDLFYDFFFWHWYWIIIIFLNCIILVG